MTTLLDLVNTEIQTIADYFGVSIERLEPVEARKLFVVATATSKYESEVPPVEVKKGEFPNRVCVYADPAYSYMSGKKDQGTVTLWVGANGLRFERKWAIEQG